MAGYSRNIGAVFAVLLLVLVAGYQVAMTFRRAAELADHSAHEALASEILEKLAAVPAGQPYPASLSELQLTYPDGGDASLLSRFSYHSTGTSCTVETKLRPDGEGFVRRFPEDAEPGRIDRPWTE